MTGLKRLLGTPEGVAGLVILLILLLAGLSAPIISPGAILPRATMVTQRYSLEISM